MFPIVKKVFIELLTGLVNESNHLMRVVEQSEMYNLAYSY